MDTKTVEEINREWNEFKAVLAQGDAEQKKFGTRLGDTEAKLALINTRIDEAEVKAQRQARGNDAPSATNVDPVRTKAFEKALRKGIASCSPDEVKLLTIADDTTGGFGATQEFDSEILKGITLISPVRELVRVRTTGARSFKFMKRTGQFAARRTGEVQTRTETTGLSYGLEEVPVAELYAMVDISRADLEDTGFNLEGELRLEFTEQFAKKEGTEFITGTAANGQMEGLTTNGAIAEDTVATTVTYDSLVDVSHNGKAGYDWRFIFNRKTLGAIRKIKDTTNQPIWTPMAAGAPATILDLPYTIVPDCDDIGAGKWPVFCGDFKRGYIMGDRTQLVIVRDEVTQLTSGAVRFYAYKRNGGQVVLAEAIRKLKTT
jgi:HK97 family phage major capsid protein